MLNVNMTMFIVHGNLVAISAIDGVPVLYRLYAFVCSGLISKAYDGRRYIEALCRSHGRMAAGRSSTSRR